MPAEMIHHDEVFARLGVEQDGLLVAAAVDDLSHAFSPPSQGPYFSTTAPPSPANAVAVPKARVAAVTMATIINALKRLMRSTSSFSRSFAEHLA
jgi:hypothetical protein